MQTDAELVVCVTLPVMAFDHIRRLELARGSLDLAEAEACSLDVARWGPRDGGAPPSGQRRRKIDGRTQWSRVPSGWRSTAAGMRDRGAEYPADGGAPPLGCEIVGHFWDGGAPPRVSQA